MYQQEKIYHEIDGVMYEITMTRKKVKRMTLRIDRQGKPCMSVPLNASRGEIWKFVSSCSDWLVRNSGERSFFSFPEQLRDGDEVEVLGDHWQVKLVSAGRTSLSFSDGIAVLAMRDPKDPAKAASAYLRALKELAERVFRERLRIYSEVLPKGCSVPEIRIRKMTSRWGSANKNSWEIHLSLYLIKTPVECIDSVVLHEAVHFTHMDHGTEFYEMLLARMPDYRERSRILREYAKR